MTTDSILVRRSIFWVALLAAGGCSAPRPSIQADDAAQRIPAMKIGVQQDDTSMIAPLIESLASDDPAVRLYANQALVRLSGQDFGYRAYDDDSSRQAAIERWQAWAAQQR